MRVIQFFRSIVPFLVGMPNISKGGTTGYTPGTGKWGRTKRRFETSRSLRLHRQRRKRLRRISRASQQRNRRK